MKTIEFILPKGIRERFNSSNYQEGTLLLKKSKGLKVYYVENNSWTLLPTGLNVDMPLDYEGLMSVISESYGDNEAIVEYYNTEGEIIDELLIKIKSPNIELNIDSNRDGIIDRFDQGDHNWVWGKGEMGGVLMVNNDRDLTDFPHSNNENSEFSEIELKDTKVSSLGTDASIKLRTTENAAKRFRLYGKKEGAESFEIILGRETDGNIITFSRPLTLKGETIYVEALELPNRDFEGLITIELGIQKGKSFFEYDKVVFRVSPWIMTPNTQPAIEVFTCRIVDEDQNVNTEFLEGLQSALNEIGVPLKIIEPVDHNNDRWIQDEIEFGYSQTPSHFLPIVFDSPRDRGLDDFPEAKLLGSDFGHFQLGGSTPNSLDSFGNLEVCPPVTVNGKYYPFGRIIFGGKKDGEYPENARQMMTEVRRFLYAQKVQSPIEIYSDWLSVAHVDEIINFVPAKNSLGFKMLIASPMRAKGILSRLLEQGHGDTIMFEGKMREHENSGISAEITVSDLMSDESFWISNARYQEYQNHNQRILEKKLSLSDLDIIQVPVLFQAFEEGVRTAAYFPDMVNHLVIGMNSIIPKPYGPKVNGKCVFEKAVEDSLPDRKFYIIDDWYSYHENYGEVHCGSNTRRKPFENKRWWEHMPDGGYNI